MAPAVFVTWVSAGGILYRLKDMHRSRIIKLRIGSRVVYYDPDDRERSEAEISRALTEDVADGVPSR